MSSHRLTARRRGLPATPGGLAFLLLLALPTLVSTCSQRSDAPELPSAREPVQPSRRAAEQGGPVTIFRGQPFYEERLEPEELFTGTLETVPAVRGPADRYLPLRLDGLPVYPGDRRTEEILRSFASERVEVLGKKVDLASEGFGPELWPATIRLLGSR